MSDPTPITAAELESLVTGEPVAEPVPSRFLSAERKAALELEANRVRNHTVRFRSVPVSAETILALLAELAFKTAQNRNLADAVARLKGERDELAAVVKRLPVTADGVPMFPGMRVYGAKDAETALLTYMRCPVVEHLVFIVRQSGEWSTFRDGNENVRCANNYYASEENACVAFGQGKVSTPAPDAASAPVDGDVDGAGKGLISNGSIYEVSDEL